MSFTIPLSMLSKPAFIDPAGDPRLSALSIAPPFLFRNVTARIFTLKANVAVLTAFCDQYLNMDIPRTIVHFAPALPFVHLMVLNYGSMAASSVQAQNVGWVAQHEVTFAVTLQRWREENGELVFKDWALVSPFIYVDDQFSLSTGREVYGWNKVTGKIDADIPLWINDPTSKVRQFQLSLTDFADLYAGDNATQQTLLQIDSDPPTTFTTFPPDPRNPWSPLQAVPNAIANATTLLGGGLDTLLSLRIRGFEEHRSLDGLKAMAAKAQEKFKGVFPDWLPSRGQAPNAAAVQDAEQDLPTLYFDNVTLKQFRNPENPDLACYQALVKSKMGVDRVNRAGLLGDVNLLRGDTSGGYSLRIHQYDSQPIIQTLGLEVDSWSRVKGGPEIATLKPILPYWLDVDLFYGAGEVMCSRAYGAATEPVAYWRDEQQDANAKAQAKDGVPPDCLEPPRYNTALGAATQPIVGPFHFPDVTLQVYPLQADPQKLKEVLENFLNAPLSSAGMVGSDGGSRPGWRFEPFGSFVYMVVTVYGAELGDMWSGVDNIGQLFDREVTFTIPVKWYDEHGELVTIGVIEPFTYSNNGRAVATDREVNGYNSIRATIDSPADTWLTPSGPIAKRRFLHLETEVIPALNVGQKAQQLPLIDIDELDVLPPGDAAGWRIVADTWGRTVTDELKRKTFQANDAPTATADGKAMALELLAHGAPLNRIILKQYRDGQVDQYRDGQRLNVACYQALVHATSAITSVYDVRELSPLAHVRMHRQPGHTIVEALGLVVKHQDSSDGAVVDVLKPQRPFWMRVGMAEDLATVACFRSSDEPWRIVHPWFEASASSQASAEFAGRFDGPTPYFKGNGETRVGAWLARVPVQTIPPRPSGDTLSVFSNAAEVNEWLAIRTEGERVGANLHLNLRNQSNDWLRSALVNELAWIRVCIEPQRPQLIAQCGGDGELQRFLHSEIQPNAITDFVEPYGIPQLLSIVDRMTDFLGMAAPDLRLDLPDDLGRPREDAPDSNSQTVPDNSYVETFQTNLGKMQKAFAKFFEESTVGIRETGLAWSWDRFLDGMITNHILSAFQTKFDTLWEDRRQAFLMTLPKSAYPLLLDTTAYIDSGRYSFDTTFQDYDQVSFAKIEDVTNNIARTGFLADMIERGLLDWTYPSRWRRISRREAAAAVGNLEDVQVVIDDILSSEWENHDPGARFLNPKGGRKPAECMRLEPMLDDIARRQGLERWIDPITGQASDHWVVPMPGASDPIQAAATTDCAPLALPPVESVGPTVASTPGAGSEGAPAQGSRRRRNRA